MIMEVLGRGHNFNNHNVEESACTCECCMAIPCWLWMLMKLKWFLVLGGMRICWNSRGQVKDPSKTEDVGNRLWPPHWIEGYIFQNGLTIDSPGALPVIPFLNNIHCLWIFDCRFANYFIINKVIGLPWWLRR